MSFNYNEYTLNSYKDEPWYSTEITLFENIISKLPNASSTYVNTQHHHARLATPLIDQTVVNVNDSGLVTFPLCSNGVAIITGVDHHMTTTNDLSAYVTSVGYTGLPYYIPVANASGDRLVKSGMQESVVQDVYTAWSWDNKSLQILPSSDDANNLFEIGVKGIITQDAFLELKNSLYSVEPGIARLSSGATGAVSLATNNTDQFIIDKSGVTKLVPLSGSGVRMVTVAADGTLGSTGLGAAGIAGLTGGYLVQANSPTTIGISPILTNSNGIYKGANPSSTNYPINFTSTDTGDVMIMMQNTQGTARPGFNAFNGSGNVRMQCVNGAAATAGLVANNTAIVYSLNMTAGMNVFTYDASPLTLGAGNVGVVKITPNTRVQVDSTMTPDHGVTAISMFFSSNGISGSNSLAALPTNQTYATMGCWDTNGTLFLNGYSKGSGAGIGIAFCGYSQLADTTTGGGSAAAITFDSAKTDGGTGFASLASTEHMFAFRNNGTNKVFINGNGDINTVGNMYVGSLGGGNQVAYGTGGTGGSTTASGTVDVNINGVTYHLLKSTSA